MPPDSLKPPGELVSGKFRLVRLLGRGGMGAVWEGVHETLGTKVAVKFIDAEFAASEEARQRFINEAKAAARLRSKHVVQVYDQGVTSDGRPYIVMEWLGGEPLDVRLDRLGRLSPAETATLVGHVCRALAKAHAAGVVHRDLKPENVFIVHDDEDRTDIAKVVDFGIAKFVDASVPGSSSTQTGAVLGTPQFMSPEQARGLRSVDHRTDLWSLGVIAYRCLTGALPFKGEGMGDLLVNICTQDPAAPSSLAEVPSGFDAWTRKALAREPGARFQSAAELADALSSVCGVDARVASAAGSGASPGVAIAAARSHGSEASAATTPLFDQERSAYESDRRGAITAQPFATTPPPPAPAGASRRPAWIAALLVVLLVGASAAVARSFFRPAGDGAAAATQPAAAQPVVAPVPAHPATSGTSATFATSATEVVPAEAESAASAAPSASVSSEPPGAARPAPEQKGVRRPSKPSAPSPSAAAVPAPPRPTRPPDVLGY